jgi:hypothetical protein
MSARNLEAFLARIYVDKKARSRFKINPRAEGKLAGLSNEECAALENTDWIGLEMAARSFANKRNFKHRERSQGFFNKTLRSLFAILSERFRVR